MEILSDSINKNAVAVLKEKIDNRPLPSNIELAELAKKLGVQGLYIMNKNGWFIRASDIPIEKETHSVFDYCKEYKQLTWGTLDKVITPVVPDWPTVVPSKFIMIPSTNRNYILESKVKLQYIDEMLHKAVQYDKSISSIGIYSPNNFALGYINSKGKFFHGKNIPEFKKTLNKGDKIFKFKVNSDIKKCCECQYKKIQNGINNDYYYILKLGISKEYLDNRILNFQINLTIIFLITLVISFIISRILAKKLVNKITLMNSAVSKMSISGDLDIKLKSDHSRDEVNVLADALDKMIDKIKNDQNKLLESEKSKTLANLASQVAHDIQSPLTALSAMTKDVEKLPEEKRLLIQQATQRINDIANNLLNHYRAYQAKDIDTNHSDNMSPELLFCLLDEIVSEKRASNQSSDIQFSLVITDKAYGLFSEVDAIKFKRVISNLINNAIEATPTKGLITIKLDKLDQFAKISIADNGIGMPSKLIKRVMNEEISSGKEKGTGIGLSSARATIAAWHGKLDIQSIIGNGTIVTIQLATTPSPFWFAEAVLITSKIQNIIVLDDDQSVHSIWSQRIKGIAKNIQLVDFYNTQKFENWHNQNNKEECLFLMDYELLNEARTGLDIIEKLKLNQYCYLVTSRYEDQKIRQRCLAMNVKIIPKYYVPHVKITISSESMSCVLIDDSEIVRTTWELAAERSQVMLTTYPSEIDFFAHHHNHEKYTHIYIDSNLADNVKGELIAEKIYNLGFHHITLTTGYSPNKFAGNYSWIKEVISKEPPF
ncbi:hypothetical protein BGC07_07945 [Piscirickettsia litoralis]|uniref:histidine kinase n=2 Tax=Piscirickettsia litoralis TaxID=1891921 RepID=A0ABX3A1Y1_9GAMM|nr:hypothetical protein BGC07_07945 [Piscirickettsia litoralis]